MSIQRMNRSGVAGLLISLLVGLPVFAQRVGADRPNIVLLFADDLGYGETGAQGNDEIPTPHIDSIAHNGIRFTQGYVTGSYCSQSRAGLLTGRYQSRFGYEHNPVGALNSDPRVGLPTNQRTLGDHLRDSGYATGLIGKWHLGGTADYHPVRRGFDEFYGFLHEGHYFAPPPYEGVTTWLRRRALPDGSQGRWTRPDGRMIWTTHMGGDEPDYNADNPILRVSQPVAEETYLTDAITRESVDFIERNKHQPFFLYVAYNAVHSPMQAMDEDMARFAHIEDVQRRIFAGMLHRLDQSVGAILEKLEAEGLTENTLVLFISDNGGPTRELTSSNLPLREGKGRLYEGGIRVPFMMSWPGHLPKGVVDDRVVSTLDLFPTAAAISGARPPDGQIFDGVNLIPFLTGQNDSPPHPTMFWKMLYHGAYREGDYKVVRHGRWNGELGPWELYNLAQDPGETQNLAEQLPQKLRELVAAWESLNGQMAEPVWTP